uniref:Magnesium-dependent phosphatase 1 n=1 Tax=Lygus hesperus TaxID=30085 RepID=A0A146M1Z9_LYGHE
MVTVPRKLPKLVVFDLDHTVWQLHVDKLMFPFKIEKGKIVDCRGRECLLFPDVPAILSWLEEKNIQVGLASRITNIAGACLLLNLFNIRHHFWPVEVYPTSKVLHFDQIRKKTELDYSDMLFFDDDKRNLRDLLRLELPCVHVPKGLKFDEFLEAMTDANRQFKDG